MIGARWGRHVGAEQMHELGQHMRRIALGCPLPKSLRPVGDPASLVPVDASGRRLRPRMRIFDIGMDDSE